MKHFFTPIFLFCFLFGSIHASGQTEVTGQILDSESGETLVGANIYIKDSFSGTISNADGSFTFRTSTPPPFTLVVSIVGYERQEIQIISVNTELNVQMVETAILGQEVVVSASRVEENIMLSPVSIERMGIRDLQQSTAANFYDGLYEMKGVDMNVQSLTFRLPNTRGFNGNTNYRMNQIVDGMDNTPAGLSFAAGNIFGLSQLDVESVELLVGASSALYGPGGMNGTLVMTSKNPFEYPGFSATVQTGAMHVGADYQDLPSPMLDFNARFAQKVSEKFAFKVTAGYLQAEDWRAVDYRDRNDLDGNSTRENNEAYDGVNVYGDDIIVPVNLREIAPAVASGVANVAGLMPGTPAYDNFVDSLVMLFPDQVVSRTGWHEEDIVDYDTRNLRLGTSLHYRINDKLEAIGQASYAEGTAVYTAQNRFSLSGFSIYSGRLELRNPDFFVRFWGSKDNAGDSFDAGAAGLLMNETWKPSADWYQDYIASFTQNLLFGNPIEVAYKVARQEADNRAPSGNKLFPGRPALPLPGEPEFESILEDLKSRTINEGGTKVIDRSGMINLEGMYNFNRHITNIELQLGFNFRRFSIDSEGTAFFDTPGNPISVYQYGAVGQIGKKLASDRLKLTLSMRYDKHEKFDGQVTPRFSFVYSVGSNKEHNFRGSIQTAYRFPAVPDQWTDLDVGQFRVIGGLPEIHNEYNFDTEPVYPLTGSNPITDGPDLTEPFVVPPFRAEEVTAFEFGYKGLFLDRKLFVDAYVFQNDFKGFLALQLLAQVPDDSTVLKYQTTISNDFEVRAQGWALGADFRAPKNYVISGNISFNKLVSERTQTGFQTQFNTPDYRFNLSLANREVADRIGFKISWRWQNDFLWESNFGTGQIPAYHTLDAQVSYDFPQFHSVLKLGASNLLNQYYTTGFGNAHIGGLYYVTWVFDDFLQ